MLRTVFKFLVFRFAGARVLLALTVFGWIRGILGKRATPADEQRVTR